MALQMVWSMWLNKTMCSKGITQLDKFYQKGKQEEEEESEHRGKLSLFQFLKWFAIIPFVFHRLIRSRSARYCSLQYIKKEKQYTKAVKMQSHSKQVYSDVKMLLPHQHAKHKDVVQLTVGLLQTYAVIRLPETH